MRAEPLVPEVDVYPGKAVFKPTFQGQQGGMTTWRRAEDFFNKADLSPL